MIFLNVNLSFFASILCHYQHKKTETKPVWVAETKAVKQTVETADSGDMDDDEEEWTMKQNVCSQWLYLFNYYHSFVFIT